MDYYPPTERVKRAEASKSTEGTGILLQNRDSLVVMIACAMISLLIARSQAQTSATQVVLLGTGTPNADPERSGPAVAIVVNDTPYLVDFGPGVVRRAATAARKGIKGLEV